MLFLELMRTTKSKSHFKTFDFKSLWVLVALFFYASTGLGQEQEKLAPGIQQLIYAEQQLLSRDLNEQRIQSPKQNHQDQKYKPENGNVFAVKSYWVPQSTVLLFESAHLSEELQKIFIKKVDGKNSVLMLVHPESETFFADFLKDKTQGPQFWATSTASSRTLMMWPDGHPETAFLGKLSLNKSIGGVVRTIPAGESARSVGTTEVLFLNQDTLPRSFQFMPETLSLIPKGFQRGGMIIREIPADIASGKRKILPLFSLYADRGEEKPLLAEMIERSGEDPRAFVEKRILAPFIKQWTELVLTRGISMEPHAQNVLIGLNSKGLPDGTFTHRDFGGFNMDLGAFDELETLTPKKLPTATNVTEDYHQKHVASSVNQGLETFFENGFVYNLDQKLPEWVKRGWIPEYRPLDSLGRPQGSRLFSKMIYTFVAQEISRITKGQATPAARDLLNDNMHEWIKYARNSLTPRARLRCEGLF